MFEIYRWDDSSQKLYSIIRKYNNNYVEISGRVSKGFNLEETMGIMTVTLPFNINSYGASVLANIIWYETHSDYSTAIETSIETSSQIIFYSEDIGRYPDTGIGAHMYFYISAYLQ